MKTMLLTPLTKEVEIHFTQNLVELSPKRKKEIEDFWEKINEQGTFHRGEVFNVSSVIEQENLYTVILNCTDYAHYLHSVRNHITDEEGCKVIYGAGMVETSDSNIVFGEMGSQTAYPGRLQCVGGGLSWEDKKGNYFVIKESILRELGEELGIDTSCDIESTVPQYIKYGGTYDFIVILYHIKIRDKAKDFLDKYRMFTEGLLAKGEKPEFQKIVCMENNKDSILSFLENDDRPSVDYLRPLLEKMALSN